MLLRKLPNSTQIRGASFLGILWVVLLFPSLLVGGAAFLRTFEDVRLPAWGRQKYGEDKVGRLIKSIYGTQDASHIRQLDYVNLLCVELGGFRRGNRSAALFHNPNQDVRVAVHGDDFMCLSDDDGLKHIDSLLESKYTAKDMGTLGFEDSDVKKASSC